MMLAGCARRYEASFEFVAVGDPKEAVQSTTNQRDWVLPNNGGATAFGAFAETIQSDRVWRGEIEPRLASSPLDPDRIRRGLRVTSKLTAAPGRLNCDLTIGLAPGGAREFDAIREGYLAFLAQALARQRAEELPGLESSLAQEKDGLRRQTLAQRIDRLRTAEFKLVRVQKP